MLLPNKEDWPNARGVFDRIRDKTLLAERCGDQLKCCQYDFEEKIAKTIYNLSIPRTPFDPDSPYWIIPSALALAERCKLPVESVLSIAHA